MNNAVGPISPLVRQQSRLVIAMALAVAAGVAIILYAASDSPVSTCTTCPASSLPPPAPACAAGEYRPYADMPHNDMPHNGLSLASLTQNQELLDELETVALAPGIFTTSSPSAPDWLDLLKNAYAPDLVQYIVSCALDPCEHVNIPDDSALAPWRLRFPDGFAGELGLCSTSYNNQASPGSNESSWTTTKPTDACLERVSACILARVNAVEARVPISMRGDGMRLLPEVPVTTQFRENHGTPIQSFKPCDEMCLWGDPARRNCDWEPRHVGQCVRGTGSATARKVRLEIKAGPATRVRICKGIYGCDDTGSAPGAGAATAPVFAHGQLVEFPTYYGGHMIPQTSSGATIEFDCPDDGPLVPGTQLRTGYYSVMLGTLEPGVPLAAGADVAVDTSGVPPEPFATYDKYPAPERQVFSYREGGFFGTIFSPVAASTPGTCAAEQTLTGDQFACSSDIWTQGAAVFTARLCAGPTSIVPNCFLNPPAKCDAPPGAATCTRVPPGAPAEPVVYDSCSVGLPKWEQPYTTYLNHPCDLFASDDVCAPLLEIKGVQIRSGPAQSNPDDDYQPVKVMKGSEKNR